MPMTDGSGMQKLGPTQNERRGRGVGVPGGMVLSERCLHISTGKYDVETWPIDWPPGAYLEQAESAGRRGRRRAPTAREEPWSRRADAGIVSQTNGDGAKEE